MIELYISNGEILLYNINDWSILRKEYRIVGEVIGNSLHIPSLPLKILPEEAYLLASKNIVTLVESPKEIVHTEQDTKHLKQYEAKLLEAQIADYKETRKVQIEKVIDKIIAKNNDTRDRDEVIKEQLAKSSSVTESNIIWPIQICASNENYKNLQTLKLDDISCLTTPLKTAVYSDLWIKGYYITQGQKFGGDFLVYFGDPICHHAIFIVKCVEHNSNISPMELITFGRVGTSVKKRAVFASLIDNKVSYITINWIDA